MTKKQKNMLTRILVTAVLYAALVAADHMKMIPAVFEGWKLLFLYSFLMWTSSSMSAYLKRTK